MIHNNDFWVCSGLNPNHSYGFRAKARNMAGDETPYCSISFKYTLANQPGVAGFTDVGTNAIRANWTANGNPAGTEYYAYCSTTGTASGWTTSTSWYLTGLTPDFGYSVYVKARNAEGRETSYVSLGTKYTLANPPATMTHDDAAQTTTGMLWQWTSGGRESAFFAWTTTPADDSGWIKQYSWSQTGLSPNTQYKAYVKARNHEDVETTAIAHEAYTSIEAPTGVAFGSITTDSIEARSASTPSNLGAGLSGTRVHNVTEGTDSGWRPNNDFWESSGLSVNTYYAFEVRHRNGDGDLTTTASAGRYTLAVAPPAPSVSNPHATTLDVTVGAGANPPQTELALYNLTSGWYVDASGGANGPVPVWRTAAQWGTVTVTGLLPDTDYAFRVKARNGDGVETAWSPAGWGHTRKIRAYVDNTPPGGEKGTGDSWADPFLTIQEGVNVADEVWVAAGTYNESVTMIDGVHVYGGFAGDETSRDQRDWKANVTTVAGAGAPAFTFTGLEDALVSGFTITAPATYPAVRVDEGYAVVGESVLTGYYGVFAVDGWPRVVNSVLTDCTINGFWTNCPEGYAAELVNNTIVGNRQSGVYLLGSAYVVNNIIVGNNTAAAAGEGGLKVSGDPLLWIYNNDVWANLGADYVGTADRTGVDGNISADPLFAGAGDYHLTESSPCVDAGLDLSLPAMDWEGQARVIDGDRDSVAFVDIGADELYGMVATASPEGWLRTGWNLISLPNEPADPNPEVVFDDLTPPNVIDTRLFKYVTGVGYKMYSGDFTAAETGVGYWLLLSDGGDVTYEGWQNLGEMRVPLGDGWNCFGLPVDRDVPAGDLLVTDGFSTYSLADAMAHGWLQVPAYYYDTATGYHTAGPSGADDDHFRRWYGYWMLVLQPGLELVVPAP